MIIIGIDPGSRRVGYGLIKKEGHRLVFVDAGLLYLKAKGEGNALTQIRSELKELLRRHQPQIAGVEKIYFVRNQKTAVDVGQTRGVIMLTLAEAGLEPREFGPSEVKSLISGYGRADKNAVAKIMRMILGLPADLRLIDDAWDALAIAYCASCAR